PPAGRAGAPRRLGGDARALRALRGLAGRAVARLERSGYSASKPTAGSSAMATFGAHCGVAEHDPRHRAAIAFFKPKQVTRESARELFTRLLPHASADDIEMRVDRVMTRIATGPIKPPAPLSQSLAEVDDPRYGLGTHPDIIEHMWK